MFTFAESISCYYINKYISINEGRREKQSIWLYQSIRFQPKTTLKEISKLNPDFGMRPITQLLHTLHKEAQIYKSLANYSLSIIRSSKLIQKLWRVKKFSLKHLRGFMPRVASIIMIFVIFLRENVLDYLFYKLCNSTITLQVMNLIGPCLILEELYNNDKLNAPSFGLCTKGK